MAVPGQAIVGGAQLDVIEAMRRSRGESQSVGRFAGQRRRVGVAGVLTEEPVLFGLQRESAPDGVGAADAQQVIAPHRNGDRGQHRDHHDERGEHFGEREAASRARCRRHHSWGARCQESRASSPR